MPVKARFLYCQSQYRGQGADMGNGRVGHMVVRFGRKGFVGFVLLQMDGLHTRALGPLHIRQPVVTHVYTGFRGPRHHDQVVSRFSYGLGAVVLKLRQHGKV